MSCGDGKRKYVRRIKTRAKHGGKKCVGNANKTDPCNVAPCPGNLHYPKKVINTKFSDFMDITASLFYSSFYKI